MLNELFAKFDELTAIHGVYKVETVGGTCAALNEIGLALSRCSIYRLSTSLTYHVCRRLCCQLWSP